MAEREGIVSHLTSLILVDEASVSQSGVPAQRKVHLPGPASAFQGSIQDFLPPLALSEMHADFERDAIFESRRLAGRPRFQPLLDSAEYDVQGVPRSADELKRHILSADRELSADGEDLIHYNSRLALHVDWGKQPSQLAAGDISQLSPDLQERIRELAEEVEVKSAAKKYKITPLVLVIALFAREAGLAGNRSAARIARALLKNMRPEELHELASLLQT